MADELIPGLNIKVSVDGSAVAPQLAAISAQVKAAMNGMNASSSVTMSAEREMATASASMKNMGVVATDVGNKFKGMSSAMTNAGLALVGITTALAVFVKKTAENARDIENNALRLGVSTQEYQRKAFVAGAVGVDPEALIRAQRQQDVAYAAALRNSNSTQARNFSALGIPISANYRATHDIMAEAARAINQNPNDPATRAAFESTYGRNAMTLMPYMQMGQGQRSALEAQAPVQSQASLDANTKLARAMDELMAKFTVAASIVVSKLAPDIEDMFNSLVKDIPMLSGIVSEIGKVVDLILKIPAPLLIAGALLLKIAPAVSSMANWMSKLSPGGSTAMNSAATASGAAAGSAIGASTQQRGMTTASSVLPTDMIDPYKTEGLIGEYNARSEALSAINMRSVEAEQLLTAMIEKRKANEYALSAALQNRTFLTREVAAAQELEGVTSQQATDANISLKAADMEIAGAENALAITKERVREAAEALRAVDAENVAMSKSASIASANLTAELDAEAVSTRECAAAMGDLSAGEGSAAATAGALAAAEEGATVAATSCTDSLVALAVAAAPVTVVLAGIAAIWHEISKGIDIANGKYDIWLSKHRETDRITNFFKIALGLGRANEDYDAASDDSAGQYIEKGVNVNDNASLQKGILQLKALKERKDTALAMTHDDAMKAALEADLRGMNAHIEQYSNLLSDRGVSAEGSAPGTINTIQDGKAQADKLHVDAVRAENAYQQQINKTYADRIDSVNLIYNTEDLWHKKLATTYDQAGRLRLDIEGRVNKENEGFEKDQADRHVSGVQTIATKEAAIRAKWEDTIRNESDEAARQSDADQMNEELNTYKSQALAELDIDLKHHETAHTIKLNNIKSEGDLQIQQLERFKAAEDTLLGATVFNNPWIKSSLQALSQGPDFLGIGNGASNNLRNSVGIGANVTSMRAAPQKVDVTVHVAPNEGRFGSLLDTHVTATVGAIAQQVGSRLSFSRNG